MIIVIDALEIGSAAGSVGIFTAKKPPADIRKISAGSPFNLIPISSLVLLIIIKTLADATEPNGMANTVDGAVAAGISITPTFWALEVAAAEKVAVAEFAGPEGGE